MSKYKILYRKLENKMGQSLLEVVFTLAIVALIVTAVVSVTTISVRNASFSKNNSVANASTNELNEWLRGQRDVKWSVFIAHFNSLNYCFVGLDWTKPAACGSSDYVTGSNNLLIRSGAFSCYIIDAAGNSTAAACANPAVNNVQAIVTVAWKDSSGTHNVVTTSNLSNWLK